MRLFVFTLLLIAPAIAFALTDGEKIAYQAGFEIGKREAQIEAIKAEQDHIAKAALDAIAKTTDTVKTTQTTKRAKLKPVKKP